jgi:hypothetical protein
LHRGRAKSNIVVMLFRGLALACICACGTVAAPPLIDAPGTDASTDAPAPARTYHGAMTQTPPVTFGGTPTTGGTPFCMYTITLKSLDVELAISPSGQVTSGRVQDLNVEDVVPSTTPVVCGPSTGMIPPNIATYTFMSATPSGNVLALMFRAGTTNEPVATLVGSLSSVGNGYLVALSFHRIDATDAVLNWTVATTLTLAPQ